MASKLEVFRGPVRFNPLSRIEDVVLMAISPQKKILGRSFIGYTLYQRKHSNWFGNVLFYGKKEDHAFEEI